MTIPVNVNVVPGRGGRRIANRVITELTFPGKPSGPKGRTCHGPVATTGRRPPALAPVPRRRLQGQSGSMNAQSFGT